MRARTKAPAAPGSVFDNFLLLYVHMLLVALTYMLASQDRSFKISSYWLYIFCTSFSSVQQCMIYGTNSTRNNSVSTRSIGLLIMMDAIIDIMVSMAKVTVTMRCTRRSCWKKAICVRCSCSIFFHSSLDILSGLASRLSILSL